MKQRPWIVTVLGVGNVVVGAWMMWLLGSEMVRYGFRRDITYCLVYSMFPLCAALILAGLGLLIRRSWSRPLCLGVSVIMVAQFATLVGISFPRGAWWSGILPILSRTLESLDNAAFALSFTAYPALLLYTMRRPDVRLALAKNVVPATIEPLDDPSQSEHEA